MNRRRRLPGNKIDVADLVAKCAGRVKQLKHLPMGIMMLALQDSCPRVRSRTSTP